LTSNSIIEKLKQQLSPQPYTYAKAAVGVLIKPTKDDIEFLLVKRAIVDDDPWSGDMAFPGGKKNLQDQTLVDTVMREVREETSIDLTDKTVLGFMEPVYSAVRKNMAVQPIIFVFEDYPKITLNYELTKYLWAPLDDIENGKNHAVVKGWEGPVYKVQGETVWGLTFRMLEKIIKLLEEN
jgi:8-oxo-dGTP pyrophosphatase MutT (NUDIX family)